MLYRKKGPLIAFLLPGFIMLFIFLYVPFVDNIRNSFYNMKGFVELQKFIGLSNYQEMLQDSKLHIALINSLKMMVLTVVFQVGIALLLAVLVSNIKRGQQFFRTVYFFPIVISATAIGLLFNLFYNYSGGALNQVLAAFGKEPVNWLSAATAFIMIVIPTIWSYVGFYFVIILTGLCDISEDIYEAAAIDGCTKFQAVTRITLPLLRGVICTCITLAVTGALKVFDLPWVIAPQGAPGGITHFMGTYMYQMAFVNLNVDYGAAIAVVIVVLGIAVSLIINKLLKPDENL